MTKKISLLFFICILSALNINAEVYEGSCGSGVRYSLDTETGLLSITGTGAMTNYTHYGGKKTPWYSYRSYIKVVEISNGVTSIGHEAFYGCSGLTSVYIPSSVTSIGWSAFYGCSGLTSVTIPNSVTIIGDVVFYGCSKLTSITIPNSVTSIGYGAFRDCTGLKEVISEILVPFTFGSDAFSGISSNCVLVVPSGTKDAYIAKGWTTSVFKGGIKEMTYIVDGIYYGFNSNNKQATVTAGENKYSGNVIIPSSVTFNDTEYSVTSIGDYAFYDCSGLTSITIPNSVTSIGDGAFRDCTGLTSVTIPNSVTSIGIWAFYKCSSLTSITIPNSVTSIGSGAFYGCSGLTSVKIGSGVENISNSAFASCSELADVYCYAENVPSTSSDAFKDSYVNYATLYVPEGSVAAYKAKEPWSGFGTINTLSGEIPVTPKCATPTISYENGKLTFSCETEGATCQYSITDTDIKAGSGNEVQLTTTYKVTVYATKAGYENSDEATLEINVSGGSTAQKGDVNEDGNVNGTDIQEVINIIVNAE